MLKIRDRRDVVVGTILYVPLDWKCEVEYTNGGQNYDRTHSVLRMVMIYHFDGPLAQPGGSVDFNKDVKSDNSNAQILVNAMNREYEEEVFGRALEQFEDENFPFFAADDHYATVQTEKLRLHFFCKVTMTFEEFSNHMTKITESRCSGANELNLEETLGVIDMPIFWECEATTKYARTDVENAEKVKLHVGLPHYLTKFGGIFNSAEPYNWAPDRFLCQLLLIRLPVPVECGETDEKSLCTNQQIDHLLMHSQDWIQAIQENKTKYPVAVHMVHPCRTKMRLYQQSSPSQLPPQVALPAQCRTHCASLVNRQT